MSSIMRRRRGLISAIGGSCLWIGLRQPQSCQTGDLPHDDPPYLPRKRVSSIPLSDSAKPDPALIAMPGPVTNPPEEHDDADPAASVAADHRPPCPCCGGRMIIVETFECSRAPRGPPGGP